MCAAQSKLTPITVSCLEYVHPWTEYCSVATAGLLLRAAQESFRIYSAVYTVCIQCEFVLFILNVEINQFNNFFLIKFAFCEIIFFFLLLHSVESIDAISNTNIE